MSRIDDIFRERREAGRTLLMPYVTAGAPSLEITARTIPALEAAGASIVEIGIPFSDPIADGPVIAAAMHQALGDGVTPDDVLDVVRSVRLDTALGLVAMVSHSIVDRVGPEAFIARAAAAGIDGLILHDIDLEVARAVRQIADAHDVSFSLLVAPTSSPAREAEIVEICTGFVYLLARTGITGARESAPEIGDRVDALRQRTDLPIAVGFGISRREHVAAVTRSADGAIVGSALVSRMIEASDPVAAAGAFVRDLAGGLASA